MANSITTKYFGPSNVRGSRIKAQLNGDGASITIPYPSWLDGSRCHEEAAKQLCAKIGWHYFPADWVYASIDRHDNAYIFIEK